MPLGDAALRSFMAEHGYLDPAWRAPLGRTIWASDRRTPRRGICSASWRKETAMSREFWTILNEVYPRYLQLPAEWTDQEQQHYLAQEAERLSRMVAELADQLADQSVTQWTRSHGHHPDYLTKVGLINSARIAAREQILTSELYEQIPPGVDETDEDRDAIREEPAPVHDEIPWDRRWTDPDWRSEPSEATETLIEQIWPEPRFSMLFRIKAGYLLASREEDGLAIPTTSDSTLAQELAAMIYHDLRSDGLPER